MSKKAYIYGGIVLALVIALGITIGIHIRKKQEWGILEKQFDQRVEQLDKQIEDREERIDESIDRAEIAEKQRDSFKDEIEKQEEKLQYWRKKAASKVKPITLVESKEYIEELEGANSTLKKSLVAAEVEIFELKNVIEFKDQYIDLTEEKLDVANDRNKALKRVTKRDKRMKIWTNILSGSGGLVVGFGLGKISN